MESASSILAIGYPFLVSTGVQRPDPPRSSQAAEPPPPDLLTISEIADLLRCSIKTIRRRVHSGVIPAYRLVDSGPWLFRRDDVLRLLTPVPVAASPPSTGHSTPVQPTEVDWVSGLAHASPQKANEHGP